MVPFYVYFSDDTPWLHGFIFKSPVAKYIYLCMYVIGGGKFNFTVSNFGGWQPLKPSSHTQIRKIRLVLPVFCNFHYRADFLNYCPCEKPGSSTEEVHIMASERDSPQSVEDEEEVYDRPRPRRRFRGLHWRHASQSHSSPPQNQPSPQHSPSQIRPLSFNLNQSGLGSFNTIHTSNTSTSARINLDSPTTSYSYAPVLRLLIIGRCQ